jgi:hypothetical protein
MIEQAATPAVEAMAHDPKAPTAPLMEFVTAYEHDDNWWWQIGCGHHENLFDAALERIEELEAIPTLEHAMAKAWEIGYKAGAAFEAARWCDSPTPPRPAVPVQNPYEGNVDA